MENEKRLIDADVLVRDINADPYRTESEKSYDRCLVHRQPTVDAVEVVRCKNCKSSDYSGCSDGMVYCMEHSCYMDENAYCSDGEREV